MNVGSISLSGLPQTAPFSHEGWLVRTTDAQGRWAMLPEVPAGANAAVQEQ